MKVVVAHKQLAAGCFVVMMMLYLPGVLENFCTHQSSSECGAQFMENKIPMQNMDLFYYSRTQQNTIATLSVTFGALVLAARAKSIAMIIQWLSLILEGRSNC